ncbi:recombinase family protein [Morganella morganii]|uniref:recombinase family protein n=1 Tax=Morganella morganii TaxID=582 RepID=UPI00202433C3|nr:recombinase family protein [Morganella morganii]
MVDLVNATRKQAIYVAQYLRMSTDNQKYSTYNQMLYISEYAKKNGMTIVKTYKDEGKSGLTIAGRPGLQNLIFDVTNHKVDIDAILIYDVSRFGRFQDPDESNFYDYTLKKSGIPVIYCAEPISNENPQMSSLYLVIQRHAAAAYSKNLSEKVFAGQKNLIELGYRQGGKPGFGLRRLLIDENHKSKKILISGERKSLQSDRVILIKGPDSEIKIIEYIYNQFVFKGKNEREIAILLNNKNTENKFEFKWTKGRVLQVLTNEKYIGNNVFNRTSFKLKKKHIKNPKEEWIRKNNAFDELISKEVFYKAQEIILKRYKKLSNKDLLDKLKFLLKEKGMLSGIIINEDNNCPSSSIYRNRFRGLINAYHLIGYTPTKDYSYIKTNNRLRDNYKYEIDKILNAITIHGSYYEETGFDNIKKINDEFFICIIIAKCKTLPSGKHRWNIRFKSQIKADINIVIRLDYDNNSALDYYILPSVDDLSLNLKLKDLNSMFLELYRFDNLNIFYSTIVKSSILEIT